MQIQVDIRKFNYRRLNHIYGKAHDAIIGEWMRWWTTDSLKGKKGIVHSAINPAIQARFWGKRYCADILLGEHHEKTDKGEDIDGKKRDFFRIVGVAEIENDNSWQKLKHRINSLYAYEKSRDRKHRIKFPDLEFGILCTYYSDRDLEEKKHEIRRVRNYMKLKSNDSNMQWVLYMLKKPELDDDFFFRVSGYAIDKSRESFYYSTSFFGKPTYHIFQKGRQLRI